MTLKQRFDAYQKYRGYTQRDLSESLGINEATLSKIILGKRKASREAAIEIHNETSGFISFKHLWDI